MDAELILKFKMENVCNQEELDEANLTFEEMTRLMIEENGLFGLVNLEEYSIISIDKS